MARALGEPALHTTYSNFKDEVAKRQGKARAALDRDVRCVLYRLQRASKARAIDPEGLALRGRTDGTSKSLAANDVMHAAGFQCAYLLRGVCIVRRPRTQKSPTT